MLMIDGKVERGIDMQFGSASFVVLDNSGEDGAEIEGKTFHSMYF